MEEREKDKNNKLSKVEHEIDLIEIAAILWEKRRFIIKVTAIFSAIGLLVAICTPNKYTASTIMVPQAGEKKVGGSLSGLAAMAGINLGSLSTGEVLSPAVYPKILKNIHFQKELIYSKYNFGKTIEPISFFDYSTIKKNNSFNLLSYIKKYTIGLPGLIIRGINGEPEDINDSKIYIKTIESLTFQETEVVKKVLENLSFNINDKEGFISISYTHVDPRVSAEVLLEVQKLLQKYIKEFKIEKVKSNLAFVEKSYREARMNFENKQEELAKFRDENRNLNSAVAKTVEEKISSEYNLLLSVYTELAKQREQAKISVTESTPILTIVEPVSIPSQKSGPRRGMMIISFTFIGLLIGFCWIFMQSKFKDFIYNITNNNR